MAGQLTADVQELYRAVYRAPDDDAPRSVLADALLEQGDPRGEFIALQLQKRPGRRSQMRMEKLLRRHAAEFLGPLSEAVLAAGQEWSRGFLVACVARLEGRTTQEPSWATVRELDLSIDDRHVPAELGSPWFKSLRRIGGLTGSAVPLVFGAPVPRPFEQLAFSRSESVVVWTPAMLEAVRRAENLPALRELSLPIPARDVHHETWLWTAPVVQRLKLVKLISPFLHVDLRPLVEVLRSIPPGPEAVLVSCPSVDVKLRRVGNWTSLAFHVSDAGSESSLPAIGRMLSALPAEGLTQLDVTTSRPLRRESFGALKAIVKRFPRLERLDWPASR